MLHPNHPSNLTKEVMIERLIGKGISTPAELKAMKKEEVKYKYDWLYHHITKTSIEKMNEDFLFIDMFYSFKGVSSGDWYHNKKHRYDAVLEGEIYIGALDLGVCSINESFKYEINLITGETTFDEACFKCVAEDNMTSTEVTAYFTQKALEMLLSKLIYVFDNGNEAMRQQYERHLSVIQHQKDIESGKIELSNDIPF